MAICKRCGEDCTCDTSHLKMSVLLFPLSDVRAYIYDINSWNEDMWGYHDMEHLHHHEGCEPVIDIIKDTEQSKIMYPFLYIPPVITDDLDKRPKYSVASPVLKIFGDIPNLGIHVLEMNEYYSTELPEGLFVYKIDDDSELGGENGLMMGDVITSIKRPKTESYPPQKWKRIHLDYEDEIDEERYKIRETRIKTISDMMGVLRRISKDETVIICVERGGKTCLIQTKIPHKTKLYSMFDNPRLYFDGIPDMFIMDKWLVVNQESNKTYIKDFLEIVSYVDRRELIIEIPDNISEMIDFEIDEKGNLNLIYE